MTPEQVATAIPLYRSVCVECETEQDCFMDTLAGGACCFPCHNRLAEAHAALVNQVVADEFAAFRERWAQGMGAA